MSKQNEDSKTRTEEGRVLRDDLSHLPLYITTIIQHDLEECRHKKRRRRLIGALIGCNIGWAVAIGAVVLMMGRR